MKHTFKRISRILGALIISLVFISVIPVGAPRLLGYEVYNIISGSMEPALPVGSAIYVEKTEGENLETGEVAVFYSGDSVIAHRVIQNDLELNQLITKGDANAAKDIYPVSYSQIIGKVKFYIPKFGYFTALYTSTLGKIFLLCILLAGVLFEAIGSENKKESDKPKNKLLTIIRILIVVVGILFIGILAYIFKILDGYKVEEKTYIEASKTYTAKAEEKINECPKQVDFDALKEINPDIVAWIYCEDTVIDYPVCHASDDDYYLNHGYDRSYAKCGAIFLEAENFGDFSDQNNILYGHHMKDKSMFATLSKWGLQSYYEKHPVMWLITPDKTYKIYLFSEYLTSATSDTYSIYRNNDLGLQSYVDKAAGLSEFEPELKDIVCDENSKFIVLSTCAYSFENARAVLHGMMVEQ